ncbi:MAG TPA: PQQ-dependent sugar dehydrogenase, partial [Pyrinomonadaceae bacterium]
MSLFIRVSAQAGRIKTYRQSDKLQSLGLALLLVLLSTLSLKAATLPAGFTETQIAAGLSNPTAMAFAPDGRLFVTQQGGQLRVIKNGTLLPTPFLTVPVDSTGERGLLGIAFDPDFATNQFVYVYYTATTPATHNRVSRFTANGDVAIAGSEVVILDLNNLSSANNHNGGALHFGPDGKLYIATGENAQPLNSQTLNNLLGKILRINADGSIPTDNPFFNIAAGVNRSIWALGLRNPYTFAFQPGTGRMFINDVGQTTWEEINDGIAGSNYGWPNSEGATNHPNYRTPLFSYAHGGPASTSGCAITGGAFYNPVFSQYPSQFVGKYFFADFCNGWIRLLDPANNTASDFASGIASPVDLQIGTDGLLYYLARGSGAVFRINFPANQPPSISSHPASQSVTEGQSVTF